MTTNGAEEWDIEVGRDGNPTGYIVRKGSRAAFYNTTRLAGPEVSQATQMAEEQNAKVLRIMQEARRPMTPWDVWDAGLDGPMSSWWLIGSVRRAMTTLSDGDTPALVKCATKRHSGPRGRLCYEWALPEHVGDEVKNG